MSHTTFFLALFPILIILVLMVIFRWSAARAGAAGYLCALSVAWIFFGARPVLLAYAHTKALLLSVDVLLIIWGAFLLYKVADEAGAIRNIGQALPHLTTDRGMQALIIGWVFASFIQGVGGFGVPVAVISPILVGLDFSPMTAVVISSVGHAWAITFGSLGSSFQALLASTGLPAALLAPPSAIFLGVAGLMGGFFVAQIAGGWKAIYRLIMPVLILGVTMGGIQYLTAVLGFWNLAAFIGSIAGLAVCYPLAQRFRGNQNNQNKLDVKSLLISLSGYAILIIVILVVQLIPQVKSTLGQVVMQLDFPETSTSGGLLGVPPFVTAAGAGRKIPFLAHTGTVLAYASILAYGVYRSAGKYQSGAVGRILGGTITRVLPSSVSILSMVSMVVIMEHAGMTDILARSMAGSMGSLFPLVSPWIGAIGAFMTGSNTNSNVVFGALQMNTAKILGYPMAVILAAQTAGAAMASGLAPTKVVVGASTAGMAGREGEVMRKLVVYIVLLVLFVSILTVIGVWMV